MNNSKLLFADSFHPFTGEDRQVHRYKSYPLSVYFQDKAARANANIRYLEQTTNPQNWTRKSQIQANSIPAGN